MGTVGDCYDNAPMESFWGSMQIELLNRKKWRTKIELSIAIAEWIEHFYNPERLHSSLGYVPPVEFEALHLQHRSRPDSYNPWSGKRGQGQGKTSSEAMNVAAALGPAPSCPSVCPSIPVHELNRDGQNGRGAPMAGSMRQARNGLQLRVHAGRDVSTGRKRYMERTLRGSKREASKALAAMVTEVDQRPLMAIGYRLGSSARGTRHVYG